MNALASLSGPGLAESPAPRRRGAVVARLAIVAIVLTVAVLIGHFTPIHAWLADASGIRESMPMLGAWTYPAAVLAFAVLLCCGIPRLLLCAVAGSVFGFWLGFFVALLGAIFGHYAVFSFVRWAGNEWALGRWPMLRGWVRLVEGRGTTAVILIRQIPAHAMLINLYLAMSPVRHRHFLLGTAIGVLSDTIPATLIGAGLVKASLRDSLGYIAVAVAALVLLGIVGGHMFRALRNRASTPPIAGAAAGMEIQP
ncbi:hypothetical protein BH09PLA1_BH09PLA1_08460 [soil metagenome]